MDLDEDLRTHSIVLARGWTGQGDAPVVVPGLARSRSQLSEISDNNPKTPSIPSTPPRYTDIRSPSGGEWKHAHLLVEKPRCSARIGLHEWVGRRVPGGSDRLV